ncbi:hypothetical protein [Streptomyces fodineus]|uniref:hypothetical protein n=1 Tax=Streptomyces fodineus TaxID=1904616 RepID=UPI00131E463F|nr:hypothetical protein [Streptomyces fodineus]
MCQGELRPSRLQRRLGLETGGVALSFGIACLPVTDNPKTLVEAGYDAMAQRYLAEFGEGSQDDPRARFIAELSKRLTPGANVLELGCGAGVPATVLQAALGHRGRVAPAGGSWSSRR